MPFENDGAGPQAGCRSNKAESKASWESTSAFCAEAWTEGKKNPTLLPHLPSLAGTRHPFILRTPPFPSFLAGNSDELKR